LEKLNAHTNSVCTNNIDDNNKTYLLYFVVQKFFEEKDRKCKGGTIKNYELIVNRVISFFKKEAVIDNIKRQDIKNYENYRLMNGANESFLLEELKLLKNIFNFAMENDFLESSPFDHYNFNKIYKKYEPRERFLTPEECQRLINFCNKYLKRLVIFILETGVRIKEPLSLHFSDIATEPKSNIQYARIRKEISKSKRERFIPLSKEAMGQINQQKIEFPNSMYIFTDSKGNCYKTTPKKAFETARKKANLVKVSFHTLRHTFASHKLQGINYKGERIKPLRIEVISEVMGHRNIDTTKKIYAKFGNDMLLIEFMENNN
jgi:integrase